MLLLAYLQILFILPFCNAATCPKKCTCSNKITRCGARGLTDIPQSIPSQTVTLQADNNQISQIPTQMLRGGRSLLELRLQYNVIEGLTVNNFRNTPCLIKLDISYNNITLIPDNAFLNLNALQTLILSSNQISRLYPGAFKDLKSLQELILTNNKIRVIPIDLLTSIPKLTKLHLDGNRISTVPDGIFSKLPALEILNLGRNRVRRITLGTFEGLTSLQQLHLHNNKLQSIDDHLPVPDVTCDTEPVGNFSKSEVMKLQPESGVFTKMKKLQLIDLQYNELSTIKISSFLGLKYLKSLTITENEWRCNCLLKWNIESLRDYLWINGMEVWLGDIHCEAPTTIKDVNLDDLSFRDLKGVAKSLKEMSSKTTFATKFNENDDNYDLATVLPSNAKTSGIDGNRKTTPMRPSIDLVDETHSVDDILSTKSPPRSLIPLFQTSAIASTTSYAFQTSGVKSYIGNNVGHSYATGTESTLQEETTKSVVIQRNNAIFPKHKEGEMIWILGTVIMVLAFFLALVGGLVARRYLRKRDNKNGCCFKNKASTSTSSVRTVCSYPLLYDNHHIARRPLPRAPSFVSRSSRLLHSEEVRWTNGGVYGLGSNRNSFVSLQTHTSSHNLEISQNSSRSNMNDASLSHSSFQRNNPKRSTSPRALSVYDLTENDPMTTSTSSKSSVRQTQSCNESCSSKNANQEKQKNLVENGSGNAGINSFCKMRNSARKLPPVPKRNSTSRERCRELKTQCFNNKKPNLNWSKNAYCEIDPRLPKETSELVENILYKKHQCENELNMVDLTDLSSNANPQISEYTKRICERIIRMHSPLTNDIDSQEKCNKKKIQKDAQDCTRKEQNSYSINLNHAEDENQSNFVPKDRVKNDVFQIEEESLDFKEPKSNQRKITNDSGYDELALCTSGESACENASQNEEKTRRISLEDCCRSSLISNNTKTSTGSSFIDQTSVSESMTTEEDEGSSDGGDDFEIIYPIVESRRTYPLGAFGSDQYILDSLLEQENNAKSNFARHTAPPGLENLTVPLSELSTDEDDVLQLQSPKSKNSSVGSLSTVLAKTPDVENDVFVYTMAGESSDIVPKITINDEEVFEEEENSEKNFETGEDLKPTQNIKATQSYQHIKNMYSGFPKSNLDSNDENIFKKTDDHQNNTKTQEDHKTGTNSCSSKLDSPQGCSIQRSESTKENGNMTVSNQGRTEKPNFQKYRRRRLYWSIELNRQDDEENNVRFCKSTQDLCRNNTQQQKRENEMNEDHKLPYVSTARRPNPLLNSCSANQSDTRKEIKAPTEVNSKEEEGSSQVLANDVVANDGSIREEPKSPSKLKSSNKEVAVQLKHALTNAVLKRSQNTSPQNCKKQLENRIQCRKKSQCTLHLDKNKNPVVKMLPKSEIPVLITSENHLQERSKRSSKHVGYFEPVDSSPDDDTDEELFDLGTL